MRQKKESVLPVRWNDEALPLPVKVYRAKYRAIRCVTSVLGGLKSGRSKHLATLAAIDRFCPEGIEGRHGRGIGTIPATAVAL